MRRAFPRSPTVALVCLAALVALRCNAVLGIESAELDPTFETGGSNGNGGTSATGGTAGGGTAGSTRGSVEVPYPGCIDATSDCANCISTCPGFSMQSCLANKTCRTALDAYRGCLGPNCGLNGEEEGCRETELFDTGEPLVDQLLNCVGGTCLTLCEDSPLVTMCELYCACMKDNCASKTIAMDANCVATCRAGATADGTITHCRKYHCEYNDIPGANVDLHCDHAVGTNECEAPVDPNQECVVPDGKIPGFPCMVDGECCAGICEGQTCR